MNKIRERMRTNKAKQEQILAKLKFWKVFWLGGLAITIIGYITEFALPKDIAQSVNCGLLVMWLVTMFQTRNNLKNKIWFYVGFYGVLLLNVVVFVIGVSLIG